MYKEAKYHQITKSLKDSLLQIVYASSHDSEGLTCFTYSAVARYVVAPEGGRSPLLGLQHVPAL